MKNQENIIEVLDDCQSFLELENDFDLVVTTDEDRAYRRSHGVPPHCRTEDWLASLRLHLLDRVRLAIENTTLRRPSAPTPSEPPASGFMTKGG